MKRHHASWLQPAPRRLRCRAQIMLPPHGSLLRLRSHLRQPEDGQIPPVKRPSVRSPHL